MKRFVFRLRALERLREVRRRDAGARLAGANAEASRLERESRRTDESADRAETTAPLPGRSTDSRAWKDQAAWIDDLRRVATDLRQQGLVARNQVQELAELYEVAAREHRVLELFHDRRQREWRCQVEREETHWLAESYLGRLVGRNGRKETDDA